MSKTVREREGRGEGVSGVDKSKPPHHSPMYTRERKKKLFQNKNIRYL